MNPGLAAAAGGSGDDAHKVLDAMLKPACHNQLPKMTGSHDVADLNSKNGNFLQRLLD
jgi:hypothetical protein